MINAPRLHPLLVCLAALAPLAAANAQYGDYVLGDRPSVGIGSTTVGAKTLHLEQGLTLARETADAGKTKTFATEQALRLGLTERIEVQTVLTFEDNRFTRDAGADASGLSQTEVGLRVALLEFAYGMPTVILQSRLRLRAVGEDFRQPAVGNATILSAEHGFTDAISFGFNVGFEYDGAAAGPNGLYAASLGYAPAERLNTFVEVYGTTGPFDLNIDGGLEYWLSRDIKVDASAGLGSLGSFKADDASFNRAYFVDAGVVWRVDWR